MTPPDAILPGPDELTEPFWAAAREHRLSLQRCDDCGRINHPPQVVCGWCSSPDLAFADVSGRGRVASFTSQLQSRGNAGAPPHTDLVVEVVEQDGVYLVSRVDGARPTWATIGTPVVVHFDAVPGSDVVLPQFGPSGEHR